MLSDILTSVMNLVWILGATYCLYQLIVRDKMSIEYMRLRVMEAYDGDSWKKRVSRMPDTQVEAIYDRLLEGAKISNVASSKVACRGSQTVSEGVTRVVIYEDLSGNRVRTDEISGQITFEDLK